MNRSIASVENIVLALKMRNKALAFLLICTSSLLINGQGILNKQEMLDRFSFWDNQDWHGKHFEYF